MAKDLSKSEIDALLSSLRRAQEDAGVTGGDSSASATAAPAWDQVGEELSGALADHLTAAWQRGRPGMSVVRGDALPPGFSPDAPSRVERLGAPLNQRIWFFWESAGDAGQVAAEALLTGLQPLMPAAWKHQSMPAREPFPEDGVLLPFRGVAAGENVPLTLGLEARGFHRLRDRLCDGQRAGEKPGAKSPRGSAPGGQAPMLRVNELEVEVSVYVGGGLYPLSSLSALRPGAVLPLVTEVGQPAVIAIAGRVIALGEVMVTRDDTLAVRLTRLLLGEEGREAGPVWLEHAKRTLTDVDRD